MTNHRPVDAWIDEMEAELGPGAVLRLLANAGGQRRNIPHRAQGAKLSAEVGADVVQWLATRFAGTALDIPSMRAREQQSRASELRAAILEAGLTHPTRSANVIAAEFGVTAAWVHKLRSQMRQEMDAEGQLWLPFFGDDPR